MAAELSRAYDEAKAKADKPVESASAPTPISPGQGNVSDGPKRDEGGRFASSNPDAKKPEAKADAKPEAKEPKADAKAPDAKDAKAPETKEPAKDAPKLEPHPRWKPEMRERFQKLAEADPETAKWVLDRQTETEKIFHAGRQAAAAGEKFKALDDILAPGRQQRSMAGVDDPTFLRGLVAASDFLAKDPRTGIKHLAETYGVDLRELADGKPGEVQDSPMVRQLQQQIAEMQAYIQRQNQGAQRHALNGAMNSIQAFAQAKDESGQLLHPHFEAVVDDVTAIVARQLESGQPPDLKAAYEKAIRLNDAIWTKTQAEKSAREQKQREEEEARRIAEAKRAGFSVNGGSGGDRDSVAGSIRDELARQVDRLYR